jgi:membrane protease YdiL (CAAX protease family)
MSVPHVLLVMFGLAVIGVGSAAWLRALVQLYLRRPILRYEPRPPVPWGLVDLIFFVAFYLGATLAAVMLIQVLGLRSALDEQASAHERFVWIAVQIAVGLLSTLLGVAVIALRCRCNAGDLGLRLGAVGRDLFVGVIAFTMLAPPVFAIQALLTNWFPYEHPLIELIKQDNQLLLLAAISAVLVAPLTEELQFRVLLQGWLETVAAWRGGPAKLLLGGRGDRETESAIAKRRDGEPPGPRHEAQHYAEEIGPGSPADAHTPGDLNPYAPPREAAAGDAPAASTAGQTSPADVASPAWWPIAASALIFATMHAGQGPAPVPLFVLALGLGYVYRQTHSVLPSIVVHALLNGTTMAALAVDIYFPLNT